MQDTASLSMATLENQLTERYGLLLSQTQLAALLGRTTGGLRYKPLLSLRPADTGPEGLWSQDRTAYLLPGHRGRSDHHR
jgi:hypothetical protein